MSNTFKQLLALVLMLFANNALAQRLSPAAEISILTFGPGTEELYSSFGHSAIRVHDPENGYDAAYNYGTFDFNQPNFYLNFAKGNLIYRLAVQDYRRLKDYYQYHNRFITEQVLVLTHGQKQIVFDYLQNNAKPENANYAYDYFYNNCATKIGDVFVEALAGEFRFDENFVDEPGLTIRELTDHYSAKNFPWGKLGIDLCLGMPMDVHLTNMQYTYIPDYVFKAFSKAQIQNNGNWQLVVSSTNKIYVARDENTPASIVTPNLVFWSFWILILGISIFAISKKFSLRWLDLILFLFFGTLGLFLFLLWVATDHVAASWNLNLLWAWPTHLIVSFWLLKKTKPRWLNWYLLLTVLFGIMLILLWAVIPQALNLALIPIVLVIITRAFGIVID